MGLKLRRALEVGRVARRGRLLRVLGEVGVVGDKPATREGARAFRHGLEELGTTFVKLGSCSRRGPTCCRTCTSRSWASSSTTCRRSRSRRRAGSSTRRSGSRLRPDRRGAARGASIAQVHGAMLRTGREWSSRCGGLASRNRSRSTSSSCARRRRRRGALRHRRLLQLRTRRGARGAPARRARLPRGGARSELIAQHRRDASTGRAGREPPVRHRAGCSSRSGSTASTSSHATASIPSGPQRARPRVLRRLPPADHRRRHLPRRPSPRQRPRSPPTAGSRCSTSGCSVDSTTTRAPRSGCCCSRSRRTGPATSPT